jgi:hypothetical protein
MSSSLDKLSSSFRTATAVGAGFLGTDAIIRAAGLLKDLITESLDLAETMGGPVTDAITGVDTLLSDIKGAFEFGVAQGFVEGIKGLNDGLDLTDAQFLEITKSGKAFGDLTGMRLHNREGRASRA